MNLPKIAAIAAYALSILLANVLTAWFGLVPVGFGLFVTAGTYAAGAALLARDFVQRYAGIRWVFAGIAVGIILSWFLASPVLAVASAAAFAVAELADLAVFTWIRPKGFVRAAGISNVVSAPLDTFVFLLIAGFPITFQTFAGQMVGKLLWAAAVPLGIYIAVRYFNQKRAVRHGV